MAYSALICTIFTYWNGIPLHGGGGRHTCRPSCATPFFVLGVGCGIRPFPHSRQTERGHPLPPINGVDNASPHRPLPACRGGQPRQYDCLIQRFSLWSGFMALWAGIATPQQAQEIVARQYLDTTLFCCPAGVRSLSPLEKMYNTKASGNPIVVAGAGMDMCQLSRLPWASQVRIHRRGTSPGMEDNHTPRQGF